LEPTLPPLAEILLDFRSPELIVCNLAPEASSP
jgi:hypothetical protein